MLLRAEPRILNILRHDPVQYMLAADHFARLLEKEEGRKWLERQLPRELVQRTAAILSSAALRNLLAWYDESHEGGHAMAASLLHAKDTGWAPTHRPLPDLSARVLLRRTMEGHRSERREDSGRGPQQQRLDGGCLELDLRMGGRFGGSILRGASLVEMLATAQTLNRPC